MSEALRKDGIYRRKFEQLAEDAMLGLAGHIATPEEGYKKSPHCLLGDLRRAMVELEKLRRDSARLDWCIKFCFGSASSLMPICDREIIDMAMAVKPQPTDHASYQAAIASLKNAELEKDKARLDWLIKQGPPGAAVGAGLNDSAWELACCQVVYDVEKSNIDSVCMRDAIDAAMTPEEVK